MNRFASLFIVLAGLVAVLACGETEPEVMPDVPDITGFFGLDSIDHRFGGATRFRRVGWRGTSGFAAFEEEETTTEGWRHGRYRIHVIDCFVDGLNRERFGTYTLRAGGDGITIIFDGKGELFPSDAHYALSKTGSSLRVDADDGYFTHHSRWTRKREPKNSDVSPPYICVP